MSAENLTAQEALDVLVHRVEEHVPEIAARIREAVNEGHTVTESAINYGSDQVLERVAPYSYEEALDVALHVLRAYLVEIPLFAKSAHEDFAKSAIVVSPDNPSEINMQAEHEEIKQGEGQPKEILIERLNATAILRTELESQRGETFELAFVTQEQVDLQWERYSVLHRLILTLGGKNAAA